MTALSPTPRTTVNRGRNRALTEREHLHGLLADGLVAHLGIVMGGHPVVLPTAYGVDLAAPKGTPIYASRDGTISYSGASSGYGLLVEINHGSGITTRYGHCSKLLVKKGQKVKQGQIIALVGSTGHSTGPHCHFEIRINGTPVNPEKYVKVR